MSNSKYPRLWCRPDLIRYWKTHNIFNVNGSLIRSNYQTKLIEGITITMDDRLRNPQYIENTYQYQKKMIQYEKPLRQSVR